MEYNELINELIDLLDKNLDIKNIKRLKTKLLNNLDFLSELENYKLNKNIENKKKLYENKDYLSYLKSETNVNLLILSIKNKFKILESRECFK
ncbi:MAG: hypothetical protein IKN63_03590 [Bacilli bacterium]|nr:hypothetical protein [Bacilli bacterium]